MIFNIHNDGIIKPILDLFKKRKNYHNHNYTCGSQYLHIHIERKNLLTIYLKYTDTDISLF